MTAPAYDLLSALRSAVIVELEAAQNVAADDDDRAMLDAHADDVLAWIDDLEARLGFAVADLRAAALDYLLIRDGAPEAADVAAAHAQD